MSGQYILVGHEPVPEPDLLTWGRWLQEADRCVALTEQDDVRVSTVFLGLANNYCGGAPLVFETKLFIDGHGEDMERYATWDEAVAGHERMVAKIFKARPIMALPTRA